MLNEVKEVEVYLCKPDSEDSRINPKLLSENFKEGNKLVGIADVLTMIASHFIYNFKKLDSNKSLDGELKDDAVKILRIWCGFEDDVTEEELKNTKERNSDWFEKYPQAEGWLRDYHKAHMTNGGTWSEYSTKWKATFGSVYVYRSEQVGYENILAQAIARGPLKNYYLVINKKYGEAVDNEIKNSNDKKPDARRQRTMLKLLSAYMLLRQLHPGQSYVLLQTSRILNWLGFESDKADRWCVDYFWQENPIFYIEKNDDYKKFKVDEKFLLAMDVKIMEEIACIETNEYDIYQDDGHGKNTPLTKL